MCLSPTQDTGKPSGSEHGELRRYSGSCRKKNGSAVTEFAVALPVLILMILGTIEATAMIFLQQALEMSAYEAARVALLSDSTKTDVEAAADTILVSRDIRSSSISVSPTDFSAADYGDPISVTVEANCGENSYFAPLFYGGRTLSGQVTMMKEN